MRKYEGVSKSDYALAFRYFRHAKRLSCPKTALNKIKQLRRGGKGEFFVLSDKRGILRRQNTPFISVSYSYQLRDFFTDDIGSLDKRFIRQMRVSVRNRMQFMPQQSRDNRVGIS